MSTPALTFTRTEIDHLRGQPLGRLATVDRSGAPQNNPVGFGLDAARAGCVRWGLTPGTSHEMTVRRADKPEEVAR